MRTFANSQGGVARLSSEYRVPVPCRTNSTIVKRLCLESGAAAALEFGLVGPLCLILIAAIIETGLILFTQAALDNATRDAARLIQLGDAPDVTTFKTRLCAELGGLVPSCTSSLGYTVVSGTSFGALAAQLAGDGNTYTAGTASAEMVVRVTYNRPFLIPWVGYVFGTGGTLPLVSTVAFRNEPYS